MQFRRNSCLEEPANGRLSSFYRALSACLSLLLASTLAWSATTTLSYDAFLNGVPVGSASVLIEQADHGYRIAGTASTNGAARLLSDWRSDFIASGQLHNGQPQLSAYAYHEYERRKQHVLQIADNRVAQVKNGKVRPSRKVHPGTDILTAFFIDPGCWQEKVLHTGRSAYRVTGTPHASGACLLTIIDDDGDRDRVLVEFGTYKGRRVPVRAWTRGFIRGSIRLRVDDEALLLAERDETREDG